MKAIDLYSGIGGWCLGLKLAGLDVVASYEWWADANKTHSKNLGTEPKQIDIRGLKLEELPTDIDVVVGSPPCTQFSFSNRGGSGDVEDGLKDIAKFLEVVNWLKPSYWVMENVPRVATIIKQYKEIPALQKYEHLLTKAQIEVFDLSDFGTPQRRKRSFIGNYPIKKLLDYRHAIEPSSLDEVIQSLKGSQITDPNYNFTMDRTDISGLLVEQTLTREETRINRENKTSHPVYNDMEFPDFGGRPARTITATCTRVSRESLIVPVGENQVGFRRLTMRERATIQGFPICYQFLAKSYSGQLKMIGNAVPPTFTFLVGAAFRNLKANDLLKVRDKNLKNLKLTLNKKVDDLTPDAAAGSHRHNRSFRFSIPNLRFKSGTRFELNNTKGTGLWQTGFFFGDSKRIIALPLDKNTVGKLHLADDIFFQLETSVHKRMVSEFKPLNHALLQACWTHRLEGDGPFVVIDKLGKFAELAEGIVSDIETETILSMIDNVFRQPTDKLVPAGMAKIKKFAPQIVAGIYVCGTFNEIVRPRQSREHVELSYTAPDRVQA